MLVETLAEAAIRSNGWDAVDLSFTSDRLSSFLTVSRSGTDRWGLAWDASHSIPPESCQSLPSPRSGVVDWLIWYMEHRAVHTIYNQHRLELSCYELSCGAWIVRLGFIHLEPRKVFVPLTSWLPVVSPGTCLQNPSPPWVGCALRSRSGDRFLHICRRDEVGDLPWGVKVDPHITWNKRQYGLLSLPFLKKVRHELQAAKEHSDAAD